MKRLFAALLLCLAVGAFPALGQTSAPAITEISLGVSTEGRPITAVRIGTGPRKLVLVGDTHGGPERNTYELVTQLIEYFRTHPQEVPEALSFYLLPTGNPDGLEIDSRLN